MKKEGSKREYGPTFFLNFGWGLVTIEPYITYLMLLYPHCKNPSNRPEELGASITPFCVAVKNEHNETAMMIKKALAKVNEDKNPRNRQVSEETYSSITQNDMDTCSEKVGVCISYLYYVLALDSLFLNGLLLGSTHFTNTS